MLAAELTAVLLASFIPGVVSAFVMAAQELTHQGGGVALITPIIAGNPAADITLQVVVQALFLYPVVLVGYVLARSGESLKSIGLTNRVRGADAGMTLALTAGAFAIPIALGIILDAVHLMPSSHSVYPPTLSHAYVVLGIANSLRTAIIEEVPVCGYLLHRLAQMRVKPWFAVAISVAVRCSYHIYGGWYLVLQNIPFGIMQAAVYQRTRSVKTMVAAHFLYDSVLFTIALYATHH